MKEQIYNIKITCDWCKKHKTVETCEPCRPDTILPPYMVAKTIVQPHLKHIMFANEFNFVDLCSKKCQSEWQLEHDALLERNKQELKKQSQDFNIQPAISDVEQMVVENTNLGRGDPFLDLVEEQQRNNINFQEMKIIILLRNWINRLRKVIR